MSKIQINNEIVILRKNVNQAKVQIIKKLTREAQKLRQKKGTEAQKAKNHRKAERLAAEILAIKKVKQDDITKHILAVDLNLKEILENQKSEPMTRMIARIAHHKTFSQKIVEFKSKYPNYLEFLGPGRKKKAKLERKLKKKNVENESPSEPIDNIEASDKHEQEILESSHENSLNEQESNEEELSGGESNDDDFEVDGEKSSKGIQDAEVQNKDPCGKKEPEVKTKKENDVSKKKLSLDRRRKVEKNEDESSPVKISKKFNAPKMVNDEAIVKKFTEILEEKNLAEPKREQNGNEKKESKIQVEKEVDPFFVMEDGQSNYMSIILPRSNLVDTEDDDKFSKRKSFEQQNNRFFSKVNKFEDRNHEKWEDRRKEKKKNLVNKEENLEKKRILTDEVLHPSWQAKKKEQELLKKGFQGKKIVFDY